MQAFTATRGEHRAQFCRWETSSLCCPPSSPPPPAGRGSAASHQWWYPHTHSCQGQPLQYCEHHHCKGYHVLPENTGDFPGLNLPLNIHVSPWHKLFLSEAAQPWWIWKKRKSFRCFGHYRHLYNEQKTKHPSVVSMNQCASTLSLQLPHFAPFSFMNEIPLHSLVPCRVIF